MGNNILLRLSSTTTVFSKNNENKKSFTEIKGTTFYKRNLTKFGYFFMQYIKDLLKVSHRKYFSERYLHKVYVTHVKII